MRIELYSIYDKKTNIYEPPRYMQNEATAKRQMMLILSDENRLYSQFPEDYQIYYIGEFDDQTGEIKEEKELKWEASEIVAQHIKHQQLIKLRENQTKKEAKRRLN